MVLVLVCILEVTRDAMVDGRFPTDEQVGEVAISMVPSVPVESCCYER